MTSRRPPSRRRRGPQTRDHRCELITPALRAVYTVPATARWHLSFEQQHGSLGWRRHSGRFGDDERARFWCTQVGIPFPGDRMPALVDPPDSCAHDPDHGVARAAVPAAPAAPGFDARARAAGEDATNPDEATP